MPSNIRLKAPRQATACQWCRLHKLKCDAEQPSCRNCARRSVACVTTNLRKPEVEGRRQLPVGRRQRSIAQSKASTNKCASSQTSPSLIVTPPSSSMYSLPLSSPPNQTFEMETPERLLPGVFASPFGHDEEESLVETGAQTMESTGRSKNTNERPQILQTTSINVDGARAEATSSPKTSRSRLPATLARGTTNSHFVLVQWLDLFFMQNPAWQPVFPSFRQGIAYTSEIPLLMPFLTMSALSPSPASIPPSPTVDRYADLFFGRVHPLFPILHREEFAFVVSDVRRNSPNLDYGSLAIMHVVCSLAADEEAGAVSEEGTSFLKAAFSLYAHLVGRPSVSSVQALLLMALALRNRNKDVASWGTLGQAIRLAQAINLHRVDCSSNGQNDLASRVWWTAYVMERTMELETGRPSAIRDSECDQREPSSVANSGTFDYFKALIGLAKLKTRAIHLLYHSGARRGGERVTAGRPVKDLLFEMGYIDRALLEWADTFPESIRPGRDIFCSSDELPLATYVTLQYHQTMVALHRPALMSAPGFLRNRINTYCAGTPLRDRLHFSLCIGAASARAILKAINDLSMYSSVPGQLSRLVTSDQILLAVLVLGIYVAKVPMSGLNRADLALVDTFGAQVEEDYRRAGHDMQFIQGIELFRTQLCGFMAGIQGQFLPATTSSPLASGRSNVSMAPKPLNSTPLPTESVDEFGFDLTMDATDLESSWMHFWNEDFEKLLAIPATTACEPSDLDTTSMANMTNMYLMGIPQSWP